jgi:hypothetical protein
MSNASVIKPVNLRPCLYEDKIKKRYINDSYVNSYSAFISSKGLLEIQNNIFQTNPNKKHSRIEVNFVCKEGSHTR